MPHKDQEIRRQKNRERMRRRRAAGTDWTDPGKEAERKARWYREQGGREKTLESTRRRRASIAAEKIQKLTGNE